MKKKVLNLEEQFFPVQEKYSVEDFAKISGWNVESVRQACREQVDRFNRKAKLPEGFYANPPRNWEIKFKKPSFIHSPYSIQRTTKEMDNPLFVNSLDTFLDYDSSELDLLNLCIVTLTNTPKILIYNVLDFIEPTKGIYNYIGDSLIHHLVINFAVQNRTKDLKKALPVLVGWLDLANIHYSYHIRLAIKKEPHHCLYCGKLLDSKKITEVEKSFFKDINLDISYMFRKYYFCSKTHKNNFDNPSREKEIVKLLVNFREKNLFTNKQDVQASFIELGNSIVSSMIDVVDNKKITQKTGSISPWSREYSLYLDLKKHFYDLDDLKHLQDTLKREKLTFQGYINQEFKGSRGAPKYTLDFLNDHDTTRLISKIMSEIRESLQDK